MHRDIADIVYVIDVLVVMVYISHCKVIVGFMICLLHED